VANYRNMAATVRLPQLYATVGKLHAELSDFDEALRLLETKLDEDARTSNLREIYYTALRKRTELKAGMEASLQEIFSHPRHRRNAILGDIARAREPS
jgi:hypothetical protein